MENNTIPELRFPEFEGEWALKRLDEMASLTSSKRVYSSDYVDKGIPFYRGKEITELKQNLTPDNILYISSEIYNDFKEKYGSPRKDDILITAVGTLGNVYRVRTNDDFYFKDGNLIWLRNVNENSIFLEQLIEWKKRELIKVSIGSTQKALTIVELNKVKFAIPTPLEQTKIAIFLTAIDERVNLLEKKKADLEQYKKGVMQKIFSQEIRFKKEDGTDFPDWEEKKLNEIIIRTSTGLNPRKNFKLGKGSNFYVTIKNISNGKIDFSTCELIDDEALKLICKRSDLSKNDIIMSSIGNIGESYLLTAHPTNWNINESVFMIRPNPKKVLPIFLYYILTGENALRYFEANMTGSSFKSIKIGDLKIMSCKIPSIKEQQKIASFLSAIDKKIEKQAKQITGMHEFKQGLLQKMFI